MNSYIKKLIPPVLWEIIFIISCFIVKKEYYLYTNFIFYFGIIIYFIKLGDFKLNDLKLNIKGGKRFWIPVVLTSIGMLVAFLISALVGMLFPEASDGMIGLKRSNIIELIIFSISTIVFPPLAEELFFRKAFIKFDSRKVILILTSLFGMLLYAFEHSFALLGIVQTMIVAIPLTISYIKTRNVYITIVGHFIINLVGNGSSVILEIIK